MTQAAQHPMIIVDFDGAEAGACLPVEVEDMSMPAWSAVLSWQLIGAAVVAQALLVPSVSKARTPITPRRKDRSRISLD